MICVYISMPSEADKGRRKYPISHFSRSFPPLLSHQLTLPVNLLCIFTHKLSLLSKIYTPTLNYCYASLLCLYMLAIVLRFVSCISYILDISYPSFLPSPMNCHFWKWRWYRKQAPTGSRLKSCRYKTFFPCEHPWRAWWALHCWSWVGQKPMYIYREGWRE